MKVKCPRCKLESEFNAANPYRPFCSERCQMIDLGQWAEGKYAIPAENPQNSEDDTNESQSAPDSDDIIH